jgi:hypothetical protein
MAEGVVDELEAVEVDEQDRDAAAAALGAAEGVVEAVEEQRAVWQPGEGVVERLVGEARLGPCARRRRA